MEQTNLENMQAILACSKTDLTNMMNKVNGEQLVPGELKNCEQPRTSKSCCEPIEITNHENSLCHNQQDPIESSSPIEKDFKSSQNEKSKLKTVTIEKIEIEIEKLVEIKFEKSAKILVEPLNETGQQIEIEIENVPEEDLESTETTDEVINYVQIEKEVKEPVAIVEENDSCLIEPDDLRKDAKIEQIVEELKLESDNQIVPSVEEETPLTPFSTPIQIEIKETELNEPETNLAKSLSSSSTISKSPPSTSTSTSVSDSSIVSSTKSIAPIEKISSPVAKPSPKRPSKVNQQKPNIEHDTPVNSIKKSNDSSFTKSKKTIKQTNANNIQTNNNTDRTKPEIKDDKKTEDCKEKAYEELVVYEFNFPRKFCGKLIGKNGVHVDFIRSKTHTQIAVRNDPGIEDLQIVCVSGRLEDVDHALDIIRSRFPVKHYQQISLKPISKPIIYRRYNPEKNASFNQSKVLVAPNMFVDLTSVKEKNQDDLVSVYVSAVVNAAHIFIQLPTNSAYENLQKLDQSMLAIYNNPEESIPLMEEPIEFGTICVAPTSYGWHRAMVTNYTPKSDLNEPCGLATVRFLDYGGYLTIPANQLRQLRSDFILLPFQAIECYLDGIYPFEGKTSYNKTSLELKYNYFI